MILRKLNKKQGFTLLEIMIVVGIVILLAAISMAAILRARVNANDGAASGSAKSIAAALESFKAVNTTYTNSFNALASDAPPYLSSAFSEGRYQGYDFSIHLSDANAYFIYAQPVYYGVTGTKFIVYDQAGLQRFDDYTSAVSLLPSSAGIGPLGGGGIPAPPLGYVISDPPTSGINSE